ncbi:MAG: hypothetical protein KF774_20465 [Planctomyces sp.]|nr:hypothetical protein [Planctomyces sp.]
MPQSTNRSLARASNIAAATVSIVVLAGCGGQAGLKGTVTDGTTPLAAGQITFLPGPGTEGASVHSEVKDGRFALDSTESLSGGEYVVRIVVDASQTPSTELDDKWRRGGSTKTYEIVRRIEAASPTADFKLQDMRAK